MTSSRIFTGTITKSHTSPCTLTELNGSLTLGDFFQTPQAQFNEKPGTGTTIEIRSCTHTTEITGHTSAFCDLSLPINQLAEEDFTIDPNNYITAKLKGDSYISSCELHDLLNGKGWKLQGLTSYAEKNPMGQPRLKTYSVWTKKSRKKP